MNLRKTCHVHIICDQVFVFEAFVSHFLTFEQQTFLKPNFFFPSSILLYDSFDTVPYIPTSVPLSIIVNVACHIIPPSNTKILDLSKLKVFTDLNYLRPEDCIVDKTSTLETNPITMLSIWISLKALLLC